MTLIESLYAQGVRALREPRAAAADVLALGIPREVVVPTLVLIAIVSIFLDNALFAVLPTVETVASPFRSLAVYLAAAGLFAITITFVGRWFGGMGKFEDALLLVAFLQAMFLPASAIQVVLAVLSPSLAVLFMLCVLLFLLWVQVNFVAALHGFATLGRAFAVMLVASLLVAIVMLPFTVPTTMSLSDV